MRRRWAWALLVMVLGACQGGDTVDKGGPDAAIDAPGSDAPAEVSTDAASAMIDGPVDAQVQMIDARPIDAPAIDAPPIQTGFRTVGALAQARVDHGAALLPDGRVLVVGGHAPGTDVWLATSEIYDPAHEAFAPGPPTQYVHVNIRVTGLADGRVLITGPAQVTDGLASHTEIFDPAMMTFVPGPDELVRQWHESATLLADGRVLLVDETAETFSPETNAFSAMPSLGVLAPGHTAVRLANGRTLFTGGPHQGSSGGGTRREAEEFDASSNTFASTGSMATGRAAHTSAPLPGGRALVAGGYIGLGGPIEVYDTAEVYDAAARTFAPTGAMTTSRFSHTSTALADGRVLLVGGLSDGTGMAPDNTIEIVASAELYNAATGTFTATPPMSVRRAGHTATRLADGRVLVVGGAMSPLAELFQP